MAIGAVWLLYALGYNMSIGVWVGIIALTGVDAETGVFMTLYLGLAYNDARKAGRLRTWRDLQDAISQEAVKRIRPKFMTVACMIMGSLPSWRRDGHVADRRGFDRLHRAIQQRQALARVGLRRHPAVIAERR